jgi:hypothetical protein
MTSELSPLSLDGRVALVTGASSGIGRRYATALVRHGASVAVAARRQDELESLRDELGADRVEPISGDLTDPDFPRELMQRTRQRFGKLDVLVNNAGHNVIVPAQDETDEQFDSVLTLNLKALFSCCREAFPLLQETGGAIVNTASIMGMFGIGKIPQAGYCASKGGVIALTRELAVQWARHGIRVNAIAPGLFPSEVTLDMIENDERSMRYYERIIPMRRHGELRELDGALILLAGPGSTYMTGQVITVDGGWTAW